MILRTLFTAVIALAFALQAAAGQVVVREFHFYPLGQPHAHPPVDIDRQAPAAATDELRAVVNGSGTLKVYPVAGRIGGDIFIPYFVDLDESAFNKRDFLCLDYTYDGHTGHDPYIRSFREQEIGVPVFAPLDGTVLHMHDGEPDQNTTADPNARSNYVVLSHRAGFRTEFFHLKRGSVTVRQGDTVTAGTQIGMAGSSGPSAAPHVHWEVRQDNVPVEPFAGPCRSGASLFDQQPHISVAPAVIGVAFSHSPFSNYPNAPHDTAPRQSTYLRNSSRVHFKVEVANVRAGDTYQITVTPPNGQALAPVSGTLTAYTAYLASAAWALEVPLTQNGTWILTLRMNGSRVAEVPFRVVEFGSDIVNRPPNTPAVSLEPILLVTGDVPVCRAETSLMADPDTDVVQYRYEWRVNGQLVREVTTAARSDAIGRQHATSGNAITCSVTLSDGSLTTQAVSANAIVGGPPRRRAAGR